MSNKKKKYATFGEKLKSLRKGNKLTQKEVAEKAGLSIVTINFYENDEQKPSLTNLQRLATALNCDFDELYELWKN